MNSNDYSNEQKKNMKKYNEIKYFNIELNH